MVRREENQIDNFKKLLQLLSDGQFHSGEELGESLGITRSAIWKLIQQFKSYDIPFASITGKGYQIPGGLSLLNKDAILATLLSSTPSLPYPEIEILDSLGSTNDYLMAKLPKTEKSICCLAEFQTAGKGRHGHKNWYSPYAANIYFSLLWHFNYDLSELSGLSLVTALAVVRVLQKLGIKEHLGLKWPNDILWKKQKLAGILIEVNGETQSSSHAVIGIGVNVAMTNSMADQKIHQPWTDILQVTGKKIDRNLFIAQLLTELILSLQKFQQDGFQVFMPEWQAFDLCLNQKVTLIRATDQIQGRGRGINEKGYFLLEDSSGKIKPFSSGEVSLRFS